MENFFLSAVVAEFAPEIIGRAVARVSTNATSLFLDFRLPDGRLLLASTNPQSPALYLVHPPDRTGAQDQSSASSFLLSLRKTLTGAKLIKVLKPQGDRRIDFEFERYDAGGARLRAHLIIALTGRTTNAYLLDASGRIEALFAERGQFEVGDQYLENADMAASRGPQLLVGVDDGTARGEIIEKFFGADSIFASTLKEEFMARCEETDAATAFNSLLDDLTLSRPRGLIYSRRPIAVFGTAPADLKQDLALSHFEMVKARSLIKTEFGSLSEAAEQYYSARERSLAFQNQLNSLRRLLVDEVRKRESIKKAIASDRERFVNPERLKQFGDLLLANLATAKITGSRAVVTDYYDDDQEEIEIEIDENRSLQQAAADYFNRYQKAQRALTAIEERAAEIAHTLAPLKELLARLDAGTTIEQVIKIRGEAEALLGMRPAKDNAGQAVKKKARRDEKQIGRKFISTDGFEIVVGRNDRDNDQLTFRVARPQDVWLHAADYPGSHVIIRNPDRQAVPHRTIIEAAELAAFYSTAKRESKVGVHYTQRKFISKPPRSKPGLVRLSSFKTLMVEPRSDLRRAE